MIIDDRKGTGNREQGTEEEVIWEI